MVEDFNTLPEGVRLTGHGCTKYRANVVETKVHIAYGSTKPWMHALLEKGGCRNFGDSTSGTDNNTSYKGRWVSLASRRRSANLPTMK